MIFKVSGNKEDLTSFQRLLATIRELEITGSSRTIKVDVDGDGSASLRFQVVGETDDIELEFEEDARKQCRERIDTGEDFEISIGE